MEKNDTIDMVTYTYDEALQSATEYFKGDELAAGVWVNKYALKDSKGNIYEKSPDQMHKRLARELARVEKNYPNPLTESEIYNLLKDFKYIVPQGSPMSGIGNDHQVVSLSNCFVIGNEEDSYGGVMKLDQELVQLMKRRGGVGLDLSFIRPSDSFVNNSALTSTGVVPFMERFSNSTREVAQAGRRGALMLTLSVQHPDSESFIDAKTIAGKVTGANVSVRVSDEFMNAVINKEKYTHKYPVNSLNPQMTKVSDASKLWRKITDNAWQSAEPGVLFWDTVIKESLPDCYADLGFKTVSTNPCGEITLSSNDSCRLLLLNLYSYVENPFSKDAFFNFELFSEHVIIAQRLMDDIVDLELEKLDKILAKIDSDPESPETKYTERRLWEKIKDSAVRGRRTGLGITAEGDMLAALGIIYGTDEGNEFSDKVHRHMKLKAYESSYIMATERGAFPIWESEREEGNPFLERIGNEDPVLFEKLMSGGRRNIALLTVAPAGSVSILTQTTSGLEPAFLISYKRRRKINPNDKDSRVDFVDEIGDSWQEYQVFHHKFLTYLEVNGYDVEKVKLMSDEEISKIIEKSPYYKATSNDVDWVKKVEMQGLIQKHIDHSISVTVNLPSDISKDMVAKVYETGWRSGCKGLTVYRDGSRSGVLVSNDEKEKEKEISNKFMDMNSPKRPKKLEAEVVRFQNNLEGWIAFVGILDGRPYEIFTGIKSAFESIPNSIDKGSIIKEKLPDGTSRYDFRYIDKDGYHVTVEGLSRSFDKEYWNYAKMISGVLRHGMPLDSVVELIKSLNLDGDSLNTWKNGVSRVIKKYIPDGIKSKNLCPECGQDSVYFQEGCLTCNNCGHAKCG